MTAIGTVRAGIACMSAGDTLILRDGYYTGFSNYMLVSGLNGTANAPYTIRAENERRAWIELTQREYNTDGDRDAVVAVRNSSYIVIEGLRTNDNDDNSCGHVNCVTDNVFVNNSHHITLRKFLVSHNNRWGNGHLFDIQNSNNIIVEDSELYDFHRHGVAFQVVDSSIIRRVYCNSRLFPCAIPGGGMCWNAGDENNRGDACTAIYPGNNNIIENVISENNDHLTEHNASGTTVNNQVLGSIALNDSEGAFIDSRTYDLNGMPRSSHFKDFVVINGTDRGVIFWGTVDSRCDNCSFFNNDNYGLQIYDGGDTGSYPVIPSSFSDNSLFIGSPTGARWESNETGSINHPNFFGNSTNVTPQDGRTTNIHTVNPQMGGCYVYLPDASPLRGLGAGGANIGAMILYRTIDGALTSQPLWNQTTGAFPCGATVAGFTDTAGNSCINVHERLHVNTADCPFPSDYGIGPTPTPALQAWWKFDEGTGTTAADSTVNGHAGTFPNGANWITGRQGNFAIHVAATGQVQASPLVTGITNYSWAMWLRGTGAPGNTTEQPFIHGTTAVNFGFSWSHPNAGANQAALHTLSDGTIIRARIPQALSAGTWYRLVATYDGSNLRMYLNGALQATTIASSMRTSPTGVILIGNNMNGDIDDVKIYNYALTENEIAADFGVQTRSVRRRTSME